MMNKERLKNVNEVALDFEKLTKICKNVGSVIPVIVQDFRSREVLILAYVNQEALDLSLQKRIAVFWSTSRNKLWIKGDTSGCFLNLIEIRVNCEQNSLLYLVIPRDQDDGVCHTKDKEGKFRKTCFYRKLNLFDGSILLGMKDDKWSPSSHKEYMLF